MSISYDSNSQAIHHTSIIPKLIRLQRNDASRWIIKKYCTCTFASRQLSVLAVGLFIWSLMELRGGWWTVITVFKFSLYNYLHGTQQFNEPWKWIACEATLTKCIYMSFLQWYSIILYRHVTFHIHQSSKLWFGLWCFLQLAYQCINCLFIGVV